MKLTPIQARNLIRQELNKGHGIYIDSRFYDVRVKSGKLQVSNFNSWFDVAPGSEFRNPHGRALFTYEPDEGYSRLLVVSVPESATSILQPGDACEIIRETALFYIVSPHLGELKVSKKTLIVGGSSAARGAQFKAPPAPGIKPFESGKWHVWQGVAGVMLSDESSKQLQEFKTPDECINWLFQFGCKEAARALNAHVKGSN